MSIDVDHLICAPVDVQFETHAETSIKIPNFTERYQALQNEALKSEERLFPSKPIPCASVHPGTSGHLGRIRAYITLMENVSSNIKIHIRVYFLKNLHAEYFS